MTDGGHGKEYTAQHMGHVVVNKAGSWATILVSVKVMTRRASRMTPHFRIEKWRKYAGKWRYYSGVQYTSGQLHGVAEVLDALEGKTKGLIPEGLWDKAPNLGDLTATLRSNEDA